MPLSHAFVLFAKGRVTPMSSDYQPFAQQRMQWVGSLGTEAFGIRPHLRAHPPEQHALGIIDNDLMAKMRRKGYPSAATRQAIPTREQRCQIEFNLLPRLQMQDRTASYLHTSPRPNV
ncbi:hypothetical protein D3C81_800110 [compost metagenome]